MATRKVAPSLFTSAGVPWASQPVVFHNKHGKSIELSQNNTVATRVRDHDHGVVCSSELLSIGQMFKVTVLKEDSEYDFGLVRLQFFSTAILPHTPPVTDCAYHEDDPVL